MRGLRNPDIKTTHSRVSGFFMRKARLHLNYGGACRGAARLAGFRFDRYCEPCMSHHPASQLKVVIIQIQNEIIIMTNQIIHFYFEHHASVRVQVINGEPWFCLKDVCDILDIKNPRDMLAKQLDRGGVEKIYTPTISAIQQITFINEPNLYRVIFRSNKPEARQFQDWVFNEVLPAIRKTGRYEHPVTAPRRNAEPLTPADMKNLSRLISCITMQFKRQYSWNNAVWHTLRRATGVPSPENFTVDDLQALTQECRRIIQITSEAGEMIERIEREAVRRIVRHREDCGLVLAELQRECNVQRLDNASMRQLERYEQIALRKLENRIMA